MGIAGVLKLVGLCKVNNDYLKDVDDKLEEMEGDLDALAEVTDSSSQIVDALKAGDKPRAVRVALEFCTIGDETKELKEIRRRVQEEGKSVDAAVATADGSALVKELVGATRKEITGHYDKVKELVPAAVSLGKKIAEKLSELPAAAASWSFAEKVGTPGAVRKTGKRTKKVQGGAEEAKTKLEQLKDSLEKIEA
jgi:hypothetical protein